VPNLTDEEMDKVLDAITIGMPISHACELVGIRRDQYYDLKAAADTADGGKLKEWSDRLVRARAEGEYNVLSRLHAGGKGTGNLPWILECCFGYSKTERIEQHTEHSGKLEWNVLPTDRRHPLVEEAESDGS